MDEDIRRAAAMTHAGMVEPQVIEFASVEEALAYMRAQAAQAAAAITPEHRALIDSAEALHVVRLWRAPLDEDLWIYGHVPPVEDSIAAERGYYSAGPLEGLELAEFEASSRRLRDSRQAGYLFGRFYSTIEPEGELGTAHVTVVVPITQETFERARARGWQGPPL